MFAAMSGKSTAKNPATKNSKKNQKKSLQNRRLFWCW